jgi:hypothetical protein
MTALSTNLTAKPNHWTNMGLLPLIYLFSMPPVMVALYFLAHGFGAGPSPVSVGAAVVVGVALVVGVIWTGIAGVKQRAQHQAHVIEKFEQLYGLTVTTGDLNDLLHGAKIRKRDRLLSLDHDRVIDGVNYAILISDAPALPLVETRA